MTDNQESKPMEPSGFELMVLDMSLEVRHNQTALYLASGGLLALNVAFLSSSAATGPAAYMLLWSAVHAFLSFQATGIVALLGWEDIQPRRLPFEVFVHFIMCVATVTLLSIGGLLFMAGLVTHTNHEQLTGEPRLSPVTRQQTIEFYFSPPAVEPLP